jgi:hypothetical protein
MPVPEDCFDGRDNDCDLQVDCDDPDCAGAPVCCVPTGPEICFDGRDNDCDGRPDCADRDCRFDPSCCVPEPTGEVCFDGRDNDCDARVDCADSDCFGSPSCGFPPDGGLPLDAPMCVPTQPDEGILVLCTDGRDNDCDGAPDCADTACTPFPGTVDECCNGVDDNGNGIADEFTCQCARSADCASGGGIPMVCWTSTIGVCAPHCAALGGDSFCQMLDPSLTCSTFTGECIF